MEGAQKNKYLIVIAGPTAVGKSSTAIELAQYFSTVIISADSRQIYTELNIGTAKVSLAERKAVPHHFIDILSITENYSAGKYETEVIDFLEHFYLHNDIAILAGGTGLFINAVLHGLDAFPEIEPSIIDALEKQYNTESIQSLQNMLAELDPEYYKEVDIFNARRLIRALSVIKSSGKTFSSFLRQPKANRNFIPILIHLELDRDQLYQRINQRVDQMMAEGLLDEVKSLIPYKNLRALNTVGYKELISFLDGEYSLDIAIDRIKQHTRNYAKRQITWFNNRYNGVKFAPAEIQKIKNYISKNMNSKES